MPHRAFVPAGVSGQRSSAIAFYPFSETMLFGNQPFIADMTELAISKLSLIVAGMAELFETACGRIIKHAMT